MSEVEDLEDVLEACVLSGLYEVGDSSSVGRGANRKPDADRDSLINEQDVLQLAKMMGCYLEGSTENKIKDLFKHSASMDNPGEIDFPKFLSDLDKIFPDPVDSFDIERAFSVLDGNKNGAVSLSEMKRGIRKFTENGMRGISASELEELHGLLMKQGASGVELHNEASLAISRKNSIKIQQQTEEETETGFTIDAMLSTLEPPVENRKL